MLFYSRKELYISNEYAPAAAGEKQYFKFVIVNKFFGFETIINYLKIHRRF